MTINTYRLLIAVECDEIVAEIFVAAICACPVVEPTAATRGSLCCLAPLTALLRVTRLRYVVDALAS